VILLKLTKFPSTPVACVSAPLTASRVFHRAHGKVFPGFASHLISSYSSFCCFFCSLFFPFHRLRPLRHGGPDVDVLTYCSTANHLRCVEGSSLYCIIFKFLRIPSGLREIASCGAILWKVFYFSDGGVYSPLHFRTSAER